MSKIINQYNKLKEENSDKLYLFESGIFYIFVNEDATKVSEKLNLKIINLGDENYKCGFPIKSKDKYLGILNDNKIDFQIIERPPNQKSTVSNKDNIESEIIRKLKSINVEYYTGEEALKFLSELKGLLK